MSANVSWMASAHNEVPWHKTNYTLVENAMTSEEALKLAKLDFDVMAEPVFDSRGRELKGYKVNVKSDDNTVLGMVTDRYKIVQNIEGFSFTDALIGRNCRYETAGSIDNYKVTWLLAKLEPKEIMGDTYNNYLVFKNSFDGKGAIKVCVTPTRIVCNNTLNLALQTARRTFSMRHVGDIHGKLTEAEQTLQLSKKYLVEVDLEYQKLASKKFDNSQVNKFWEQLFPIDKKNDSSRKQTSQEAYREAVKECYNTDDLANFKGTGFGIVNAVSDMVAHMNPLRMTDSYYGNLWDKITDGHPVLDQAYTLVNQLA